MSDAAAPLLSRRTTSCRKMFPAVIAQAADVSERDGKKLYLSSTFAALPSFLFHTLFLLPFDICILLPCALVSRAFAKCFSKKRSSSSSSSSSSSFSPSPPASAPATPPAQRPYDLILFGATGFTGTMAARYMAKNYGMSSFKWAIAGRRRQALEDLRASFGSQFSELPIIIADAHDPVAVHSLANSARVVLAAAGPFALYGEVLVKACAESGTHYCDITGETDWVRQMIDLHDDSARRTGAKIVHHCGHDCIPWDICVHHLAEVLRQNGDCISRVDFFDEIAFAASGGTVYTATEAIFNRAAYKSTCGFDPLLKSAAGTRSESELKVRNQSRIGYSPLYESWIGQFYMASVMANCVRRSNALCNYSSSLTYCEARVFPGLMAASVDFIQGLTLGLVMASPPVSWVAQKTGLMPAPGSGPTESQMDDCFLKVTAVGSGAKGSTAVAIMYFPTDPGYRDTARMLVEAGLVLALQPQHTQAGGGVLTPAACMAAPLLKRLQNTGCSWFTDHRPAE